MKKIVLVEDKKQLADLYSQRLSKNYQVTTIMEGSAVIETVKKTKPHLIILDLILPGEINGYDLVRELKRNEDTKNIPILIYTSLSRDSMPPSEDEERLIAGYLDKSSTDLEGLVKKVGHVIA